MPDFDVSSLNNPDILHDCAICPRNCHVDRFSTRLGFCKSDASLNISSIVKHMGEEPVISGPDGICNIFFTHCNLQCIYCQNYQISKNSTNCSQFHKDFNEAIREITSMLDEGITRVGFVSPSHFIPQMLMIIEKVESLGYKPIWVYNTNGYDRPETIRALEGIIDVYLPDLKYVDSNLSKEYSDAGNYPDVAKLALKEMFHQKGSVLHLKEDQTAISGMIIRHLVLPGQIDNSLGVLRFIAEELSPKIHISLMSQYFPTPAVKSHPLLRRTLTYKEYSKVVNEMDDLGMYNGWIQQMDSSTTYRPDFEKEHPFG
ncbi:MAG: 4Fe-4S cluster-binding domain-containing protein [Bacteroidota bacterium]|nr:4Fe-4S cluster-binding domain-containing protein [Bacteroidota bacterium]